MRTKTHKINNEAKSYLAKLLATENISVEHRKVKTASFDVKNRVLTLPIWKHMSNDIIDLLVSHEIGHALYTHLDEWKSALDEGLPHSFLNVIEDARIEKLVKRRYPGLVKSFVNGYRELIDNNFFGTKDKDVNEMLLIDRLNMHFKTSIVKSDIEFTTAEMLVVKKMENLETFNDVVVLARELAEYCKDESEMKGLDQHSLEDLDDDEDGDNDDTDNNDEDSKEQGASKSTDKESTDDNEDESQGENSGDRGGDLTDEITEYQPQAETDNYWEDNKEQLIDPKSKDNTYVNVYDFKNVKDFVVDYKEVLTAYKDKREYDFNSLDYYAKGTKEAYATMITEFKSFQKKNAKAVNFMVKEFEMKKAATAYSRSKQDKSGVIDPLKLHSYKYNDDIFKRLTITPDGKNHGLMMFIDWSGSMADKLTPTIHQLMNLVMFCRKVNIPYEVYAFSNSCNGRYAYMYSNDNDTDGKNVKYKIGDILIDTNLKLLNYASSRMNAKEHETSMSNLYLTSLKYEDYMGSRRRRYDEENPREFTNYLPNIPEGYGLSSTPLNETIMAAMRLVPAFQRKYSIDKMNTVFLTDGSSDGRSEYVVPDNTDKCRESKTGGYSYSYFNPHGDNVFVQDKQNKKNYLCTTRYDSVTEALFKMFKDKTGSKLVGFFISGSKRLDRHTLDRYFPQYNGYDSNAKVYDRSKVLSEFRKQKCLIVKDNTAYDEFYLLAGDDMKITDGQMATPSDNAKKGEIKRLFTQNLKSNRSSRIVMNKFITQVA